MRFVELFMGWWGSLTRHPDDIDRIEELESEALRLEGTVDNLKRDKELMLDELISLRQDAVQRDMRAAAKKIERDNATLTLIIDKPEPVPEPPLVHHVPRKRGTSGTFYRDDPLKRQEERRVSMDTKRRQVGSNPSAITNAEITRMVETGATFPEILEARTCGS